jgi:hypothetical protein
MSVRENTQIIKYELHYAYPPSSKQTLRLVYALRIYYTQGQQRKVSLGDHRQNDSHTVVLAAVSRSSIGNRRYTLNFKAQVPCFADPRLCREMRCC